MNEIEQLNTIFNAFHDGTINGIKSFFNFIELEVEIRYLAEMLIPNSTIIFLQLKEVNKLYFTPWCDDSEKIDDFEVLNKEELEVTSSKIINEEEISVQLLSELSFYPGGELLVSCVGFQLFNQNRKAVSFAELISVTKSYWDSL